MSLNNKQKAWAALLGIITLLGICIYLVYTNVLVSMALVLPAFLSYPLLQYIWTAIGMERRNTVRILNATFRKVGFSVENTEWNDEHTAVRYYGKFRGDNFMVEAAPDCAYINIYDMPWFQMKSSDPQVPQLMEAVNDTNARCPNMCVVVCDPSEDGNRDIYTLSRTVLPSFKTAEYLDGLMCEMLNQKSTLMDNMKRPRPWMNQKKSGPIGFTVPTASDVKG